MTLRPPSLTRRATLGLVPAAASFGPSFGRTGWAQPVEEAVDLSLATATPGGGFPAYGDALAAAVAGADPGLRLRPRNTTGSGENARLLAAGEVDLALVAGEVATEALRAGRGVTAVAAMYATPGLFAVRGDSAAASIRDLVGRPVAWGARGSGFVVLARKVLGGLGLDIERDFRPVFLDHAGEAPAMVADGRVAALWGGGAGWPAFTAIAAAPAGARFVAPDAEERRRAASADPALGEMVLPAGSYPGQAAPVVSVGTWSYVLARPAFPDEVAYRLARAIDAGGPLLASRLPQGRETTPANTLRSVPGRGLIQPGALRYIGERGASG